MHGWTVKALGLPCFSQALCLSGRTSNRRPIETARFPVVRSIGLFAIFSSWSDLAWNVACARADLCKVDGCFIFLEYPLFGLTVASAGMGKPEIFSRRTSGIFLLWHEARRSIAVVVVISASGYISWAASVVRRRIASHHVLWRGAWLSKWAIAGGIYFWRTSPMTDTHLLLAPKPAPQATCQKCRRHGYSVHRPVRPILFVAIQR